MLVCERGALSQKTLFVSVTVLPKIQTYPAEVAKNDDFCMPFPSRCLRKLAGLPDHLVRQDEERRRESDPERLGGLEVDDPLELRRLLHRQGSSAASSSPLRNDAANRSD